MKNKELKKQLIENNAWEQYSKQRFEMRKKQQFEQCENYKNYKLDERPMTEDEFIALKQIGKARKEQRHKIREWEHYYTLKKYNGEKIGIYFGTFSYRDTKKETTAESLKRKIIKYISPNVVDFIINIDYGRQTERMHYHAILVVKDSEENKLIKVKRQNHEGKWRNGLKLENKWLKRYEKNVGFYDMEPVEDTIESFNQLSNYVNKLVMHSIKVKQAYISTKKGTEYQEYKKVLESLKKPIKERTEEENDRIKQFIGIKEILDNMKHFRDVLKYLKMPNNFDGTTEQLEFWKEENERREKKNQEKIDIFEGITPKMFEKDKQIYEALERLRI